MMILPQDGYPLIDDCYLQIIGRGVGIMIMMMMMMMRLHGDHINTGTPKWMVYSRIKIDDLGVPHFRKPSYMYNMICVIIPLNPGIPFFAAQ